MADRCGLFALEQMGKGIPFLIAEVLSIITSGFPITSQARLDLFSLNSNENANPDYYHTVYNKTL